MSTGEIGILDFGYKLPSNDIIDQTEWTIQNDWYFY